MMIVNEKHTNKKKKTLKINKKRKYQKLYLK